MDIVRFGCFFRFYLYCLLYRLYNDYKNLQAKRIMSDVWNKEEFNSFLACVSTQRYKTFFAMLFYTGSRKSEIWSFTRKRQIRHPKKALKSLLFLLHKKYHTKISQNVVKLDDCKQKTTQKHPHFVNFIKQKREHIIPFF